MKQPAAGRAASVDCSSLRYVAVSLTHFAFSSVSLTKD